MTKKGVFALFWSYQDKQKLEFLQNVGKILDQYEGTNRGPAGYFVKDAAEETLIELNNNSLFTSVDKKEFHTTYGFTAEKYMDLVLSYSWVHKLTEEKRFNLLEDLKNLFQSYRWPINIPYGYVLLLAKNI